MLLHFAMPGVGGAGELRVQPYFTSTSVMHFCPSLTTLDWNIDTKLLENLFSPLFFRWISIIFRIALLSSIHLIASPAPA